LPTASNLERLWHPNVMEDIDDTLTMLMRAQYTYGMKISSFHEDVYFVKTSPNEPQKAYSSREEMPVPTKSAIVRYVLYADLDRDYYSCSVNRFGVPNWGVMQKCMEQLGVPNNEAYRQLTQLRSQYKLF
jgi:hypothetical protein